MASTFLFRRLLVALVTEELSTVAAVVHRLGAEEEVVVTHLARLAGVMFARDDGESFQVSGGQSLELQGDHLQLYFMISPPHHRMFIKS